MKESGKNNIKLNQQLKRIEVSTFEIDNAIVFNYFDRLKTCNLHWSISHDGRPYFGFSF